MNAATRQKTPWHEAALYWAGLGLAIIVLFLIFRDALLVMESFWSTQEEYSHGYLIPLISAFLIWQRRNELAVAEFRGSWFGAAIVLSGSALYFIGELSTITLIVQYAFLIVVAGVIYSLIGGRAFKAIAAPLFFLVFMIPLPEFLYNGLSTKLQLLSSELGVSVIRSFGISVHLEGNVIDLGQYKLQVVEACNGLRYLFPLMSFGFICAYLFKAPLWQRSLLFLSGIPITVIMNSFRIGVIGILVEYWGTGMAEGFLHDFEGWVVFMFSVGIMVAEMWLLTKLHREKVSLRQVFGVEVTENRNVAAVTAKRLPRPYLAGGAVLVAVLMMGTFIEKRAEAAPMRKSLTQFPSQLSGWQGRPEAMETIYLDALKLTDYTLTDYRSGAGDVVNLYVAYYASQRQGESIHSPRSCIPGGGWQIQNHSVRPINDMTMNGKALRVNRIEIQKDSSKQLVYYWFKQRSRTLTNEYAVKWYILWDALTRNRTDGSLIRLTTPLRPAEDWQSADKRLLAFASEFNNHIGEYIPD